MANFYPYLVSSLPLLHFEGHTPFSFKDFLNKCQEFIPEEDMKVLNKLQTEDFFEQKIDIIKRFSNFQILLRNELVRLRAVRKNISPEKYLRITDQLSDTTIHHIGLASVRAHAPLEAEKILDQAKWNFLDTLLFGHYFDLEVLIVYGLKLLILERWKKINEINKEIALEKYI
ncbi:MAG: DUF2764 family protein [Candidatus Omnitrophota bacterium]